MRPNGEKTFHQNKGVESETNSPKIPRITEQWRFTAKCIKMDVGANKIISVFIEK